MVWRRPCPPTGSLPAPPSTPGREGLGLGVEGRAGGGARVVRGGRSWTRWSPIKEALRPKRTPLTVQRISARGTPQIRAVTTFNHRGAIVETRTVEETFDVIQASLQRIIARLICNAFAITRFAITSPLPSFTFVHGLILLRHAGGWRGRSPGGGGERENGHGPLSFRFPPQSLLLPQRLRQVPSPKRGDVPRVPGFGVQVGMG